MHTCAQASTHTHMHAQQLRTCGGQQGTRQRCAALDSSTRGCQRPPILCLVPPQRQCHEPLCAADPDVPFQTQRHQPPACRRSRFPLPDATPPAAWLSCVLSELRTWPGEMSAPSPKPWAALLLGGGPWVAALPPRRGVCAGAAEGVCEGRGEALWEATLRPANLKSLGVPARKHPRARTRALRCVCVACRAHPGTRKKQHPCPCRSLATAPHAHRAAPCDGAWPGAPSSGVLGPHLPAPPLGLLPAPGPAHHSHACARAHASAPAHCNHACRHTQTHAHRQGDQLLPLSSPTTAPPP